MDEKALQHKILEKNRRDGLRIEYNQIKYDLGLCKGTRQVDVLRIATARLMNMEDSQQRVVELSEVDRFIKTLISLMEENRQLDKEIAKLESALNIAHDGPRHQMDIKLEAGELSLANGQAEDYSPRPGEFSLASNELQFPF